MKRLIKENLGVIMFLLVLVVGMNAYIQRVDEIKQEEIRIQESR